MDELKNINEKYNSLIQIRKQKDIDLKIWYNNIEEIDILINRINYKDNPIMIEKKDELIDIYESKKMEYKLYYKSFYSNIMENIDIGKEYKSF